MCCQENSTDRLLRSFVRLDLQINKSEAFVENEDLKWNELKDREEKSFLTVLLWAYRVLNGS